MSSLTGPDGVRSEFTYNGFGRLTRIEKDGIATEEYFYSLDTATVAGDQWTKTRSYLTNATSPSYADDIVWYNGLGLPDHRVETGAGGGSGRDVIHPVRYDAMLRDDATVPLPYVTTNLNHRTWRLSTAGEQAQYYTNLYGSAEAAEAYTGKEYELSPLGRVRSSWEPGTMGLPSSGIGDKRTTYSYVSNGADEVMDIYSFANGTLSAMSYRPSGTLSCVVTTDPDGHTLKVYRDGLGRTVLERRSDGTADVDTYYAYDPMGRLRWVVTPKAVADVIDDENVSPWSSLAKRLCYYYEYDARGRVTLRRIPGAEPLRYSYDEGDRVLTLQDGNLAASGDTLAFTYDGYGRETGRDITGPGAGILSRTTYDAYPFLAASPLVYDGGHLTGLAARLMTPTDRVTARRERILGTQAFLDRAYYYDRMGNVIQEVEYNAEERMLIRTSRRHDLHGNILEEKVSTYTVSDVGTLTAVDSLRTVTSYDQRDRPVSRQVYFRNDGGHFPPTSYGYDGIGRLSSVARGFRVIDRYSYNIQGRETDHVVMKVGAGPDTLFRSRLRYYDAFDSYSSPSLNGSISSCSTQHKGGMRHTIDYSYDGLGRLRVARAANPQDAQPYWHNSDYLFDDRFSYDKNSNLVSEQYSFNPGGLDFDEFTKTYAYTGNRRSGWTYDNNGNVTAVPGKVSSVTYNILNLPSSVTPSGGGAVTYHYSSDGEKLSAEKHTESGSGVKYIYAGPFRYRKEGSAVAVLDLVNCEGGVRIARTASGTYQRQLYVTDHLGSTRLVTTTDGTVLQQEDYTPYGRKTGNELLNLGESDYLWGGKEFEEFIDIPWYDSGARFLTTEGVFASIDPLCEKGYHLSPYTYCAGDPVNRVDPEGMIGFQPIPPLVFYYATAKTLESEGRYPSLKTAGLIMRYPIRGISIGPYLNWANNITSVAGHFAINFSRAMGVGHKPNDPENNALRHTIWQALLTNKYGEEFAERVGNAHENYYSTSDNEIRDREVDINNNVIGRQIGKEHNEVIDIVNTVLSVFHTDGLYEAVKTEDGYSVRRVKLSDEQYRLAMEELSKLKEDGLRTK